MQPDLNFFVLLEHFEGFESCPYKDQAGIPTIGIGTTFYPDGKGVTMSDPCIDHDKAVDILTYNLSSYINAVNTYITSTLTQNQFNALLSFTYNEGTGALKTSHLRIKVNTNPNDPTIQQEFAKWNKVRNPKTHQLEVNSDLVYRRNKEWELYNEKAPVS